MTESAKNKNQGRKGESLATLAHQIRKQILIGIHESGGGHFGGSLSVVDVLLGLFVHCPLNCVGNGGDKLLFSKAHGSMALYAVLNRLGYLNTPLATIGEFGSALQGHPDRDRLKHVDFSFGSLGQGIAVGVGISLALRIAGQHVWVVVGDGECQEGMIWEAAMLASRYQLGNLHVVVDANGKQECGWDHDDAFDQRPIPDDFLKWESFGWNVSEFDGHDDGQIEEWIDRSTALPTLGKPSIGIARTRKNLGSSDMLSASRQHYTRLSDAEFVEILKSYDEYQT